MLQATNLKLNQLLGLDTLMASKLSLLTTSLFVATSLFLASCGDKTAQAPQQTQNTTTQSQQVIDPANFPYTDVSKLPLDPTQYKLAAKQEVTLNLGVDFTSLDPAAVADSVSRSAQAPLFDTLFAKNNKNEVVPLAAQSYSVSEDGKVWTFKLHPNATWSDGKPVTAHDFVYAWQRIADPKTAAPDSALLEQLQIVNASDVINGKRPVTELGVTAKDDFTFEVHLTNALPWLPLIVSNGTLAPVRKDVIDKFGDRWATAQNIVTNGPFLIDQYRPTELISYKKNPNYYNADKVVLEKATYLMINDQNATFLRYQSGELDLTGLPANHRDQYIVEKPEEVTKSYGDSITYFLINTKRIPNPDVRRAFKLLINEDLIVDKILKSGRKTTLFAPAYVDDAQKQTEEAYAEQDQEARIKEARELLNKAGITKENPLVIDFNRSKSPIVDKVAVAVVDFVNQGSEGALQIKDNPRESKVYFEDRIKINFDITLGGWGAYHQASGFLDTLRCTHSMNQTHWCNPEYDALLDKAILEPDADKRATIYAQANEIIQRETPQVNLFNAVSYTVKKPTLGGYNPYVGASLPYLFVIDKDSLPATK